MKTLSENSFTEQKTPYPNEKGRFGEFGGRFVPETLFTALEELEQAFRSAWTDTEFQKTFQYYAQNYIGRPTPLYFAQRMTEHLGSAQIYLKREDLAHTGAHKINNALGQCLLTKRMGKTRVIAETGAGQHGVATATAAALLGLECCIYMGTEDIERQRLNVFRMQLLGAKVIPVDSGSKTLKDAINEALRDWSLNVKNTHYVLGTVHGPHPFPWMCREFQKIIGIEAKQQILQQAGRLPNMLVACVGGGSNSIGLFYEFLNDKDVKMVGVEAGGKGLVPGMHAARFAGGTFGMLHGAQSYVLQDEFGQIGSTHSISAGLDYASVGPEHAWLHSIDRVEYTYAMDDEVLEAFQLCARLEGILPALESAHALAYVIKEAPHQKPEQIILVNLSGRGDKDVEQVLKFIKLDK